MSKKENKLEIAKEVATAVAIAVPLLIAGQPGAALSALSAASPNMISSIITLVKGPQRTESELTWKVLSKSFSVALALFFARAPTKRRPVDNELQTLVENLVRRAELNAQSNAGTVTPDMLFAPLKIPFVRDVAKVLPHELKIFNLEGDPANCRTDFENCFVEALQYIKNTEPAEFSEFERGISGALNEAVEKRKALSRHHESIIRAFTQRPVFGQEDTGITLSDLYVRQRAVWNTREKADLAPDESSPPLEAAETRGFFHDDRKPQNWTYPLHVDDLHSTIWSWLKGKKATDAMRVIAGGPGSGKSTFARAIAIEVIDQGLFDVLFVPLQEIEATGTFQQRIEHLFRDRTDLGLDGVPNPLSWLGVRDANGGPPEKPLLLICDGLDEIAPPDSAEAVTVTSDFIQSLKNWMDSRNSGGLYTCAIVLGRTISAQEAFKKAAIDASALIRVGGLLPIKSTEEWQEAERKGCAHDHSELASLDQRTTFWENWCAAAKPEATALPVALQGDTDAAEALEELTTEPLLLYLLVWTGYLGERWEIAAQNRNNVYEEIFRQIYVRRWGIGSTQASTRNYEGGGHASIENLDPKDFFLLQEALGLASWATGGRTVALEAYSAILRTYLDDDTHEDLSKDLSSSLKSVALQSYTRSIGSEDAGYEFVHKSIGEYLIARGLTTWVLSSLSILNDRITESRCARAAADLSKLIWNGPLTAEINQFLIDEIRLRIQSAEHAKQLVNVITSAANWIIINGIPVNRDVPPGYSMARTILAEQRALDVFWTVLQAVAAEAFPAGNFENGDSGNSWSPGPVAINWQGPFGFAALYSKLSSPALVAETKRIAQFNYLDLRGQVMMEMNLGAVLYAFEEDGTVLPTEWLRMSLYGANLSNLDLHGTNLWNAELSCTDLSLARFSETNLSGAKFYRSKLISANLSRAKCINTQFVHADLTGAEIRGAIFTHSNFTDARLVDVNSRTDERYTDYYTDVPVIFVRCELSNANLRNAELSFSIIVEGEFTNADLRGVNLKKALLINTTLEGSIQDAQTELPTSNALLADLSVVPHEPERGRKRHRDGASFVGAVIQRPNDELSFALAKLD